MDEGVATESQVIRQTQKINSRILKFRDDTLLLYLLHVNRISFVSSVIHDQT